MLLGKSTAISTVQVANDQVFYPCERPCYPQQIEGFYSCDRSATTSVSLFCEGWPSWIFVLNTLQISCSYVFLTHSQSEWMSAFQQLLPSTTFLPFSKVAQMVHLCAPVCLVQGSTDWVQRISAQLPADTKVLCALHRHSCLPGHPHPSCWEKFNLSHLQCGGVLEGPWVFLIKNCTYPHESLRAHTYHRRIRHIVETTSSISLWTSCEPPLDDSLEFQHAQFFDASQRVLDWNGPLPMHRPLSKVRCPCVFSPTKWVIRSLTVTELGHAFDVPSHMASLFQDISPKHWGSLPFLHATPVKVLTQAAAAIFGATRGVEDPIWNIRSSSVPRVDSLQLGKVEEVQLGKVEEVDEAKRVLHEHAVRADDAAIPLSLWDTKIWALSHNAKRRAEFNRRYHCCPLAVLRKFLLIQWRRKLRCSLIRFLRREYGAQWAEDTSA